MLKCNRKAEGRLWLSWCAAIAVWTVPSFGAGESSRSCPSSACETRDGVVRPCPDTGTGSDAARNHSGGFNGVDCRVACGETNGVKLLVLGNSIALHAKCPQIGWTNEWGMAASSAERDFAHLVASGIERKTGRKVGLRIRNVAEFERTYKTLDVRAFLADEVGYGPDYLIVALGENVADFADDADRQAYREAFERLLGLFHDGVRPRPNTVVRGVFWKNAAKDEAMRAAARKWNVPFAELDFGDDPHMRATGLFGHPGVAAHPGDEGMRAIAERILSELRRCDPR